MRRDGWAGITFPRSEKLVWHDRKAISVSFCLAFYTQFRDFLDGSHLRYFLQPVDLDYAPVFDQSIFTEDCTQWFGLVIVTSINGRDGCE